MTSADSDNAVAPWHLGRLFMMRIASMPFHVLNSLRAEDAATWARELLSAEERLRTTGAELSDPLGGAVPRISDDGERRRLLDLRRRMFNNRLPGDLVAALALADGLGGELGAAVAGWLRDRERWERTRADGAELYRTQLAASRAELLRLYADDRLRLGLPLASPTLDGQLDAFLRGGKLDKRGRKAERSMLAYLYRTAAKTSPFSTFTSLALGRFTQHDAESEGEAGSEPGPMVGISGSWTSHVRLNVVVLAHLADRIAADERLRGDVPVQLSSGWDADGDRVRYVQRSHTSGDDDAPVSFDAAHDRLFFLRRSGALEQLLARLREQPAPRLHELADLLARREGATREQADQYISALLQLGILQLSGLHTDVHSADPPRSFQQALRAIERPWAERAADLLDGPIDCVDRYPAADLAGRRALLGRLRRELTAVLAALGAPDATLPQTLIYEDSRAADESISVDGTQWADLAGAPLRSLARIMPAFDIALAQQLTLKGFFLARHGVGARCDDLLKFVHDFHEDIFDQYLLLTAGPAKTGPDGAPAAEENWLRLPQITALDRARAAFVHEMRERWAALPEGTTEFELDDDLIESVAACLEPLGSRYDPQSHFLQYVRREPDPLFVLNDSFGGIFFPFTRFTHCFDTPTGPDGALSDQLREELHRRQPPGAVFAEITAGSATTNLNLHGRMTEYEIVCPGEPISAPEAARLHLDDLYLEHDAAADRLVLRSRRLGREVVPLYLGYLLPMILPQIPRTLLLLSPTSRALIDVWRGVPEEPGHGGVTTRPRVRYRGIVLSRRRWSALATSLPPRAAPEPDADWYLAWRRWQAAHGLPTRVFATVRAPADQTGGPAWTGGGKPQYIDFDSPLSLIALEGLTAGEGRRVVFEEMLPDPDELHVASPRGAHVAEFAIELVPDAGPTGQEA